jgi:hypothetical protein
MVRPKTVFVIGRFDDFGKSIDALDAVLKLPTPLRSTIDEEMKRENTSLAQISGPVDVAAALNPGSKGSDVLWAASVPFKTMDDALHMAQATDAEVVPTAPGSYRTKQKKGDARCDLTPSLGDSPVRAVCADNDEALKLLTPWMVRGLAVEPKKPVDLSIVLEWAPLKQRYLAGLKSEAAQAVTQARSSMHDFLKVTDAELLDAPEVLSRELFAFADDSEALELDFKVDAAAPELSLTGAMVERAKTSWFTQVLASASDHAEVPPEMFYRLPKDASDGWWGTSADPALLGGMRRVVHKLLSAVLSMPLAQISASDQQSFLAWWDAIPTFSGTWVGASGHPRFSATPGGKDLTAQQAIDSAKRWVATYLPWGVGGGQGDSAPFIAWMKVTETAVNRGVADIKKAGQGSDVAWLPTAKFTMDAPDYPKGSATLDFSVTVSSKDVWDMVPENESRELTPGNWGRPEHPKGKQAKGTITLRIVVVPEEGGRYWVGYSTDQAALRSHLAMVRQGAPASGQLSSRTDLGLIKTHRGFGAFVDYGWFIDLVRNMAGGAERKQVNDVISGLPHKGHGAFYVLGSSTGGDAPTFSVDFVAGKDLVEDVSAAVRLLTDARAKGAAAPGSGQP